MKKHIPLFILIDGIIVFLAFLLAAYFKTGKEKALFTYYWIPFLSLLTVWIASSLLFGKYNLLKYIKIKNHFGILIQSNVLVLLSLTFVLYVSASSYSRFLLAVTVLIATFFEGTLGAIFLAYKNANKAAKYYEIFEQTDRLQLTSNTTEQSSAEQTEKIKPLLINEIGEEGTDFVIKNAALGVPTTKILSTTTKFNILNLQSQSIQQLINIKKLNDVGRINKFIEAVNGILPVGGVYIGKARLYHSHKKDIFKRYPMGINNIMYTLFFITHRILPKLYFTRSIYFYFTKGKGRVLSKAETLGRLYSCGFEVIDESMIDGELFFACRKVAQPTFDESPTYGPLIRLNRYGKGGKIISVYKMRTMHPYSEYLQDYIYKKYDLQKGGKFSNDFRITTVGKIMRKLWIDEWPMFINVFKGEMKIVGVRPLSKHYFNLYTPELKQRRTQFKPGLVPPFYVDMPQTLEEIMASENTYLEAYEKHPFRTDMSYFFKAVYNILIKKARSQ